MENITEPAFTLQTGTTPVLISMPHNASRIPPELVRRMHPFAHLSPDTDWFIDRLYDVAPELGIGVLQPTWSRYVIDLNRPADDTSLYPGADTTGLVPLTSFDRHPIYRAGEEPDAADVQARLQAYWQPYHQALQAEIDRLLAHFGVVVVFEAHSIASHVPRFFEGQLPDLNLGTADGASCDPSLAHALTEVATASGLSWVLNGRFKGGYITRAYARPDQGVHCVQLELSQATYLDEHDRSWKPSLASVTQPVLQQMLETLLAWTQTRTK